MDPGRSIARGCDRRAGAILLLILPVSRERGWCLKSEYRGPPAGARWWFYRCRFLLQVLWRGPDRAPMMHLQRHVRPALVRVGSMHARGTFCGDGLPPG